MAGAPTPVFFATPEEFGAWLETNGATAPELLVGYWKAGTGRPSMTWPRSVEQALRFGWIDGVRRSLGDESYCIRFTPRRPGSAWSATNVATARRLVAEGRMAPAGLRAFEARAEGRSGVYSYEQPKEPRLPAADLKALKADAKAWAWYSKQTKTYRKVTAHWVSGAKKEETRARRLKLLVECSREGKPVPPFVPRRGKAAGPGAANRS
jgi:uncharacterized protein YdeI (YjbR/CyaY-like superfamily)